RAAFSGKVELRGTLHPPAPSPQVERGPGGEVGLSYRVAFWGAVAGMVFLTAFLVAAKVTPWVAVAFLGLFFVWCVALTRIRAEAGMGGLTGPMTPQETMYLLHGSAPFGA